MIISIEQFKKTTLNKPLVECSFKLGDKVDYTNDYGVTFLGNKIIGFSSPTDKYSLEKFIHIDDDCFWSPVSPSSLKLSEQLERGTK